MAEGPELAAPFAPSLALANMVSEDAAVDADAKAVRHGLESCSGDNLARTCEGRRERVRDEGESVSRGARTRIAPTFIQKAT